MRLPSRVVLIASVYVPGADTDALRYTCDKIYEAVAKARRRTGATAHVVIMGDFNGHDQLWGGDDVS
jgi:exonuclease III